MWQDNDTDRDFLNFSGVSETIAEMIVQAGGRPISIGVSGAWGTGKSSMIRLTRAALARRKREEKEPEFIFVEFNAWLYQGYDDARAALIDVILTRLEKEAEKKARAVDKVVGLMKRLNWLRVAKLGGSLAALAASAPSAGLIATVMAVAKGIGSERKDKDQAAEKFAKEDGFLRPEESPPKEIHALRESLLETLTELNVTLVVLIDDLDRCLPETTISTLEAIRLFLFMEKTAFVVAADNQMIKHAVRRHFEGMTDEQLVASYFDKLIQVPIQVPTLGTQEVRAYLMMLFVENSGLGADLVERIRTSIADRLKQTWQGARIDRAFVSKIDKLPNELLAKLDAAERLAHIMTTASGISGNPRLIKRFLNALSIRMSISRAQGVGVDEAVLAKLLLFERLGTPQAYSELSASVSSQDNGHPTLLAEWEFRAAAGEKLQLTPAWDTAFVKEWLLLSPPLAKVDLRGALFVSREHAPLITAQDRLSSKSAELLEGLLAQPAMSNALRDDIATLPRAELEIIMEKVLSRARQEQSWGVPPILDACLTIAEIDGAQANRLVTFLIGLPPSQIKPSIVPKLSGREWTSQVFDSWEKTPGLSQPVKAAMRQQNGDVAVK